MRILGDQSLKSMVALPGHAVSEVVTGEPQREELRLGSNQQTD